MSSFGVRVITKLEIFIQSASRLPSRPLTLAALFPYSTAIVSVTQIAHLLTCIEYNFTWQMELLPCGIADAGEICEHCLI